MLSITPISNHKKCSRCGSRLFLSKKKKQKIGAYLSPVVISIFKCSNTTCQGQIDKEIAQGKKIEKENKLNDTQKGKRVNLRLKKTPRN